MPPRQRDLPTDRRQDRREKLPSWLNSDIDNVDVGDIPSRAAGDMATIHVCAPAATDLREKLRERGCR